VRLQQASERRCKVWENLGSRLSSLGKLTSSLPTLLVRQEIIATTYPSTISKLMYSGCILKYESMYLYSYPSIYDISGLTAGGAWEQCEVCLKMTIRWPQRYTPRSWFRVFGNALGGGNRAHCEIHLNAVIEQVSRCTWRPWSCELGGRNRASVRIHLEDMIVRTHNRAILEIVTPLVLQVYFRDHSGSLNNPNIDTQSKSWVITRIS